MGGDANRDRHVHAYLSARTAPAVVLSADGARWGLASLWNAWTDKDTGEAHESYTMLTLNAIAHPLMSRKHRPAFDPATKQPLALDKQDKRSVIPLDPSDFDQWLEGTVEQARGLMRLAPTEVYDAGPVEPEQPALVSEKKARTWS